MNDELNKNGYLVIKNAIPPNRVEYARTLINTKVNYYKLKNFLDSDMINTVNNKLNMKVDYTKYRVSNNNNSNDAGSFHRDLQSYSLKTPEVFTVLTYLDKSHMEMVPTTHKNIDIPVYKMPIFLNKRTVVEMTPGDILIFYATTVHRGIFYKSNNKNRRLIQLFDCVNLQDQEHFKNNILHIPCRSDCSSLVNNINIALNKNFIFSELVNLISTVITFKGYGYPYYGLHFITNDKEIMYLSTESNNSRLATAINKDEYLEINKYIMNFKEYKDINSNKRYTYKFFSFGITTGLCLTVLVAILYLIFKNVEIKKQTKIMKKHMNKLIKNIRKF